MSEVRRKTREEIMSEMGNVKLNFREGQLCRHKSGDLYEIVGHTIDCKTNEILLTYRHISHSKNWSCLVVSRPAADFVEPRFTKVNKIVTYASDAEIKQLENTNISVGEKVK